MHDAFVAFWSGLIAGSVLGITIFACLVAARQADERAERLKDKTDLGGDNK